MLKSHLLSQEHIYDVALIIFLILLAILIMILFFTKIVDYMEIKFVVFVLNTDSACGSHGFRGSFYHGC